MNLELGIANLQRRSDQYRAMLRDALLALGVERSFEIICDLEKDFHATDDMGEKLLLHAALVGASITLFEEMQAEVAAAKAKQEGGE